uniref:Uncharacterized protein n=1 Tax=Timema tahoe TaxID=61484 RepID=A0A7R9IK90_9NEOP|nr:unnamed protein product [Timema tahoe]
MSLMVQPAPLMTTAPMPNRINMCGSGNEPGEVLMAMPQPHGQNKITGENKSLETILWLQPNIAINLHHLKKVITYLLHFTGKSAHDHGHSTHVITSYRSSLARNKNEVTKWYVTPVRLYVIPEFKTLRRRFLGKGTICPITDEKGSILKIIYLHLFVKRVGNHLGKTTLSRPDQNPNLDLPVFSRPVQHESCALDHSATRVGLRSKSWIYPSKKINIYQAMSLEANYALKRIYNWSDLDLKKPEQQQQRTVQLLQHAIELCSNFYKAEQNKRQTNTQQTGKIKDHVTNKINVPIMKTDEMIIKPDRRKDFDDRKHRFRILQHTTVPFLARQAGVFFSEARRQENSGMRIEYSGRLGTMEYFPEVRLQG